MPPTCGRQSVADLDISPKVLAALQKSNLLDIKRVLSLSNSDIEHMTKLSKGDVTGLKRLASESVLNRVDPISALDLRKSDNNVQRLSTGCQEINKLLRGGILARGITEISGVSASGKTQLCLQLCLNAQLPLDLGGLSGGTAYICTEDVFPNRRLIQMIQFFRRKSQKLSSKQINFDDNIFIEHISDLEELNFCIHRKLPLLLGAHNVKLVIIDSIAAIFRCDYAVKEMLQRSKHMCTLANKLRDIGDQYKIPIVCVNQVTDSLSKKEQSQVPALGLTWANQITSRIMLSKTPQTISLPLTTVDGLTVGGIEATVRRLEVVFAPHLPKQGVYYVVDQEGIKALTTKT
ncbi:hypothetical protein FSP39_015859 [Pinctada imbricata]|uniref:RecA family profile 1 domain-containing protein n=1 Tax=Pinctada imbricata TaxID=66713 RepID=A0AA89BXJ2_PINIB|nr:hypothetical protein FSP39_015859 [Pinctada imbricata]